MIHVSIYRSAPVGTLDVTGALLGGQRSTGISGVEVTWLPSLLAHLQLKDFSIACVPRPLMLLRPCEATSVNVPQRSYI